MVVEHGAGRIEMAYLRDQIHKTEKRLTFQRQAMRTLRLGSERRQVEKALIRKMEERLAGLRRMRGLLVSGL